MMTPNEFRRPANLALFLPFSCNQSLQLSAFAHKGVGAQPIEATS
jgi:hypothetical protein